MGWGGVLAQAVDNGESLDVLVNRLVGQVLGFVLVVGFAIWLWRRDRRRRHTRPPVSGWYPDPWGQPLERWWNGESWTPNVRPAPWAVAPGYGTPPVAGPPQMPPGPASSTPPGWQPPPASPWSPTDPVSAPGPDDRADGAPPSP